ncbi:MAG TPA: uracil-DNA glycosylase [candidate division Zixibacteria bacterium]|nr:uracil-DNA glycosylase [candidate division Zixibacteria bacterium]
MGVGEAIINKQSDRMQADILVDNNSAVSEDFSSLEEHFNQICNCQKCSLGKSRNKFVYGIGNPNADILFIGEAPGANEDLKGEPFVGRAGELLDKILAAIQLSRQTVYIANILKCRPPGNRDPLPEERELCFPYLYKQIDLIKPKFICTLGLVASQELLQTKEPLGRLRKNWQNFRDIPVLVTYHPAALLRFPKYKRDTWEDMKKLKARYESMR